MEMLNFSSGDITICAAADLAKALQTPRPKSPFQLGDYKLKEIMELDKKIDALN